MLMGALPVSRARSTSSIGSVRGLRDAHLRDRHLRHVHKRFDAMVPSNRRGVDRGFQVLVRDGHAEVNTRTAFYRPMH
jgi:hypothetical protein